MSAGVTAEQLLAFCPAFPGAVETQAFGESVSKHGWNAVRAEGGLAARAVRDMVEDSCDPVVAGLPVSRRPG